MIAGTRPVTPTGAVELKPIDEREPDSRGSSDPGAEPKRESVSLTASEAGAPGVILRRAGVFAAVDERGAARALVAVNPDPRGGRIQTQTKEAVGRYLAGAIGGKAGDSGTPDASVASIVWLPEGSEMTTDPAGSVAAAAEGVRRVISGLLGSNERSSPIDMPLLVAALVFALIEIVLARRSSHAEVLPTAVKQAAGAVTAGVVGGRVGKALSAGEGA